VTLRNNVICGEGNGGLGVLANTHNLVVDADSTNGFDSDYNLLTTIHGNIGRWEGVAAPMISDWQRLAIDDLVSIAPDPATIWVDPDGADETLAGTAGFDDNFHLFSPFGHADSGALAPVEAAPAIGQTVGLPVFAPVVFVSDPAPSEDDLSPAVDWGDPSFSVAAEPLEHGRMINLGAYGGTEQASLSPGSFVNMVAPLGNREVDFFSLQEALIRGRAYEIQWRSHDRAGAGTVEVLLCHGTCAGVAPNVELVIDPAAPDSGSYLWTVPSPADAPTGNDYVVGIRRAGLAGDDVLGQSRRMLVIADGDAAPSIVATSLPQLIDFGHATNAQIGQIELVFSENLDPATVDPANFSLTPPEPFSLAYTPGPTADSPSSVTLTFTAGALPEGTFQLQVSDAVTDLGGLALDGDENHFAGGDYSREFTIDRTGPTATIAPVVPDPRNQSLNEITIEFSESVVPVEPSEFATIDRGWYRGDGFHNPDNLNYLTGIHTVNGAPSNDFRSFYVVDLTDVTEPLSAAQLVLQMPTFGIAPSGLVRTLTLFDVTTDLTTLTNGTGGVPAFDDLGSGVEYGSVIVRYDDVRFGALVVIDLNAAGVHALNEAQGSQFAFGAAITDLVGDGRQMIFSRSDEDSYTGIRLTDASLPQPSHGAIGVDDFRLTRDGGPNLLTGSQTLDSSDEGRTWTLGNLGPLTMRDGNYELELLFPDSYLTDLAGNPLTAGGTVGWTIDTTAPTVDVIDIAPDPRDSAIGQVEIVFSEAVTNFDLNDLLLTRNGDADLLTGGESLTTTDQITWVLDGLNTLTGENGLYEFRLQASGSQIADSAGNLLLDDASEPWTVGNPVVARHLFYNGSAFDGGDPSANAADDNAIATDKSPLLPGEGPATFANYSSYVRGINGVMIDIADLPAATLDPAADFRFRVGDNNDFGNWRELTGAELPSVAIRPGDGEPGSDRITLHWPDGTIVGQWIEVTVRSTAATGLAADDVFYFGNAPGETGSSSTDAVINGTDFMAIRANPSNFLNPAAITNPYDFDRDGRVNAIDLLIVRDYASTMAESLNLISAPASFNKQSNSIIAKEHDGDTENEKLAEESLKTSGDIHLPDSDAIDLLLASIASATDGGDGLKADFTLLDEVDSDRDLDAALDELIREQ